MNPTEHEAALPDCAEAIYVHVGSYLIDDTWCHRSTCASVPATKAKAAREEYSLGQTMQPLSVTVPACDCGLEELLTRLQPNETCAAPDCEATSADHDVHCRTHMEI